MKWLAGFAFLFAAAAAEPPKVFYSKSFPGSVPAYVSVDLARDGKAVYQEAPKDEYAQKFQLSPEETAQVFELVEKLDYFKRPLEADLKVANMGMKTFRYENGAEKNEVKFNYSLDESARLLADWFERLTETQQHLAGLERSVRFDKLGVNKVLLQLESSYTRGRLVGSERFLPLLDRVSKNESFLHMARERAAALADSFRNPRPKTAE